MSQENVDMVERAFEAWNRADIEGYLAHLSSDVEGVPVGACFGAPIASATITAVIAGAHTIIFAEDAGRAREFLHDVLGFEGVDAGEGDDAAPLHPVVERAVGAPVGRIRRQVAENRAARRGV